MLTRAYTYQREELARDIGRLRRRLSRDGYDDAHLVDRIAHRVECLDSLFQPTAGELVRAGFEIDDALRIVDDETARLRSLLGVKAT